MGLPKEQYTAYIASAAWKAKRKLVLERDNYACRCCEETEGLQVHHRHYHNLGNEELDDLTTLCQVCHDAITNVQRERKNKKYKEITVTTVTERIVTRYEFSENDSNATGRSTIDHAQWTNGRSGKSNYPRYERDFGETEKD